MLNTFTFLRCLGGGTLLLGLLAGCNLTADVDAPGNKRNVACTGPGATTPDKLLLRASEHLSTTGRTLYLVTRTQTIYPCVNYILPFTFNQDNDQLIFSYGKPYSGSICLTALGPAQSHQNINQLASGSYALTLHVGTRSTTGTLLVQPDRIELSSCDTNLVAVREPVLRRIPAGTIWTRAHSVMGDAAGDASVRAMRDSLLRLGAQPLALVPGPYGQFTIDANGLPVINRFGYYPSAVMTSDVLRYTGAMSRLQAYINRHRASGVHMSIQAENGQQAN